MGATKEKSEWATMQHQKKWKIALDLIFENP